LHFRFQKHGVATVPLVLGGTLCQRSAANASAQSWPTDTRWLGVLSFLFHSRVLFHYQDVLVILSSGRMYRHVVLT